LILSEEDSHGEWFAEVSTKVTEADDFAKTVLDSKTPTWLKFPLAFEEFLSCPPAIYEDSAPATTEDDTTATASGDVPTPGPTATEATRT
jgi:hypothetical protein